MNILLLLLISQTAAIAQHGSSLYFDGASDSIDCDVFNHTFKDTLTATQDQAHDLDYYLGHVWLVTRDANDATGGYIIKYKPDGSYTSKNFDTGDNRCMAAVGDFGYMWCAMIETPARIVRVNAATLACTTYVMDTGENDATSICSDGVRYLYMGLNTYPGKLIKFDTQTGLHTTYTFANAESRIYWNYYANGYVWCVGSAGDDVSLTDGYLLRFNPATGTDTSWQIGEDLSHYKPHHIAYDGSNIWVCFSTAPAKYIKFDMTACTYDSFSITGNNLAYLVEYDARGWLWLTTFGNAEDKLFKVDTGDGTYAQFMSAIAKPHGICIDSTYRVWLANYLYPTEGGNIQKTLPTANEISVEAWIYIPTAASNQYYSIMQKYGNGWILYLNNRQAQFLIHDGTSTHTSPLSSTIGFNTWAHVAGVFDGDYIRLYLNGIEQGTPTAFSDFRNVPTVNMLLGGTYNNWDFHGYIADARVYHRALNAAEIAWNYANPKKVYGTNDMVGWWKLDEFTGTTASDSSGYDNDGTIVGATWSAENPVVSTRCTKE